MKVLFSHISGLLRITSASGDIGALMRLERLMPRLPTGTYWAGVRVLNVASAAALVADTLDGVWNHVSSGGLVPVILSQATENLRLQNYVAGVVYDDSNGALSEEVDDE